jgi:hypothetical protein
MRAFRMYHGGNLAFDLVLIDKLMALAEFTHVAVRPNEDEYDVQYWQQNENIVRNSPWTPGAPNTVLYKGTIQSYERSLIPLNELQYLYFKRADIRERLTVAYELYDSHYYLENWVPRYMEERDSMYIVGGDFYALPGTYTLPFMEGHYTNLNNETIDFYPKSSGKSYHHPLVHFDNADFRIDFGWYSIFQSTICPKNFKLRKPPVVKISSLNSVQAAWVLDTTRVITSTHTG